MTFFNGRKVSWDKNIKKIQGKSKMYSGHLSQIYYVKIERNVVKAYSGSRYPGVPPGVVTVSIVPLSVVRSLDIPKSAILACSASFSRMLEDFMSLWTIGGLQPLCRYSNPAILSKKLKRITN